MVMSRRSVHLTTIFFDKLDKAVNQYMYFVYIFLEEEVSSWSLSTKEYDGAGMEIVTPGSAVVLAFDWTKEPGTWVWVLQHVFNIYNISSVHVPISGQHVSHIDGLRTLLGRLTECRFELSQRREIFVRVWFRVSPATTDFRKGVISTYTSDDRYSVECHFALA